MVMRVARVAASQVIKTATAANAPNGNVFAQRAVRTGVSAGGTSTAARYGGAASNGVATWRSASTTAATAESSAGAGERLSGSGGEELLRGLSAEEVRRVAK